MNSLIYYIRQEICRNPQPVGQILMVYSGLVLIFGLLCSPNPPLWQAFFPILLMGVGYGTLSLSLPYLFQEDWEDGSLEWITSQGKSLEVYALAKILTHWVRFGLPLTFMTGILSNLDSFVLVSGIALTTLTLTLLGAIGSALCLSTTTGVSLLLPLLTLPLGIPMMVVSIAPVTSQGVSSLSCLALQGGLFFMACSLSLIACPFALRLSLR